MLILMSEHIFGVTIAKIDEKSAQRMHEIVREEGGIGMATAEGKSWFAKPGKGGPFDARFSRRVMHRIFDEMPEIAVVAWPYLAQTDVTYHPKGTTYDVLVPSHAARRRVVTLREAIEAYDTMHAEGLENAIVVAHLATGQRYVMDPSSWQE